MKYLTILVKQISQEKVFGIQWKVTDDEISCETGLNSSEIEGIETLLLSKRKVLGFVNGIYDPLGLVAPVTIKAKLMTRVLWTEERYLNWDDHIPVNIQNGWKLFVKELLQLYNVRFKRCVKPQTAVGDPELIMFSDGSKESFGAVSYIRWLTTDGIYESFLLASKNRVASVKTIDIVRLELCGAVLSKRLRTFIVDEMRYKFKAVYHLTDSQIVKSMISKNSYGFNTFVANRIGEIQEKTKES